jgi:hypothetical protein
MTHEQILQDAIKEYVKNTQEHHDWKDGEFRVTILNTADKSDPMNQMVVLSARFSQDGKMYGWRGTSYRETNTGWSKMVTEAVEELLKDMKQHPNETLEERQKRENPFG